MNRILFLFTFIVGFTWANVLENTSPVLLWSPERSMVDFPDVSSVDSFSPSDFHEQFLLPLMHKGQENAVVFLQDKLSVDDFTNYADVYSINSQGGAFKNVKRLMEDHFSLEVPSVDSPHAAVEKLMKSFDGQVHTINGLSQLKALKLDNGKRFLLIVNLHPVLGSSDEENSIRENDAIVGDVTNHLRTLGVKYSALLTGKSSQPAETLDLADASQHNNRHLLATAEKTNCTFMNVTNKIYVYLCTVKVCIKKADKAECQVSLNMTATKNDAKASVKTNNTAVVSLDYANVKDSAGKEYTVKIEMNVALKQDRWVIEKQSLSISSTAASNGTEIKNGNLTNSGLDTVIPRPYSFHCSQLKLFLETVKETTYKENAGSYVVLEGFQLQVFDISNNRFFHAQDCVGFFTTGIWMGIVPGLLLVAIMIYGTMMVLNLSVMDKFDDPKGKTITVNVGEG